ncbi:FHA domain-containing protein, partial [Vibrio mediterranei]
MAISIHLVSIPEQEAVASRIVHLPEEGGVIGRSPDCDVVLPDHSSRISRKHAAITLTNDGYFIQDLSRNGINLNDKSVQGGLQLPISDGDIIAIADYSLLVSTLTASKAAEVNKEVDVDTLSFNINASDDVDFLETSTLSSIQVEPMTNDF